SSVTLPSLAIVNVETNSSLEKKDSIKILLILNITPSLLLVYNIELDADDKDGNEECNSEHKYSENENLLDKNGQENNDQPKKRKRVTRIIKKDKGKK
ncbi:22474_t:CDS:2, partial [Gigaspora rosea]